jgi:hypothetical protein
VLTIAGLVVAGFLTFQGSRKGQQGPASDPTAESWKGSFFNRQNKEEQVFRLVLPQGAWKRKDDFKQGLKAVVALQRSTDSGQALLAVSVQDFGQQMPRDAELIKGAIERLEGRFGENLEVEEQAEKGELAGQPASVLRFLGDFDSVLWKGECYALAYHGLAYWVIVGGAPPEETPNALADLQEKGKGLILADVRSGWSEQPPPVAKFKGLKTAFTITGPKAVWASVDNAKDADPNAELFLQGKGTEEGKDNLKTATVLVVSLNKGGGDSRAALKAAREYLEEGRKEENKGYRLAPVSENKNDSPDEGREQKIGNRPGRLTELMLARDKEPIKYILLAVVPLGEQILVLQCEAHWQHYQAWRRDFLDLLNTFRLGANRKE